MLGDTVLGEIHDRGDIDYWVFDVPAGRRIRIQPPSRRNPLHTCLYDIDGETLLNCFNNVVETHLTYPITVAGRYILRVWSSEPSAGAVITGQYELGLVSEPFALGSGDPAVTIANLAVPNTWERYRISAGFHSDLYAAALDGGQVLHIDHRGELSTVAAGLNLTGGLAVDGFGNVLVSVAENGQNSIWSIAPGGEITAISKGLGLSFRYTHGFFIAVGPDGDIWAGQDDRLWRLDPTGGIRSETRLNRCGMNSLAVSPIGSILGGTPYFSSLSCQGIHRLTPNGLERVDRNAGELAVDAGGQLYVGAWDRAAQDSLPEWGRIFAFDPHRPGERQIASVPYLGGGLVFLRDMHGIMTSRLVALQQGHVFIRRIVELGGAGERPVGSGLPVRFLRAEVDPPGSFILATEHADTLRISGAVGAPLWSIENGELPPGISLSTTGVVQGTPADTGSFTFNVRVKDGPQIWFGRATIRVAPVSVSVAQVTNALLGAETLHPALVTFLDRHGNKNGVLDIGDLHAYLRAGLTDESP